MQGLKSLLFLLFTMSSLAVNAQEIVYKKQNVQKIFTVQMPKVFTELSEQEATKIFKEYSRPISIYGNEDRKVTFNINVVQTPWNPQDLALFMSFQKSSIMSFHNNVNFLKEGKREVHGESFFYYEFEAALEEAKSEAEKLLGVESKFKPIETYTYLQCALRSFSEEIDGATVPKNKALILNFTCPKSQKDKWKAVAEKMMNSIQIKDSGLKKAGE